MKVRSRVAAIAGALILCGMGAQAALAVDPTGTWEGSWSCKGFDGAAFKESNKTSTMLITQTGNTVSVSMDAGSFVYNGGVIDSTKSPATQGRGMMNTCIISNDPFAPGEIEMMRFSVKATEGGPVASFKGSSNISGDDGARFVGSCKYKYVRTSATNPGVPSCGM